MNDDTQQALTTVAMVEQQHHPLDLAIDAWLHAHGKQWNAEEGRYEQTRTSQAYEDTMNKFRAGLHKKELDLDSDPGKVALLAQVFAYSSTSTQIGKQVTHTTVNHRYACLSSFYAYARRMKLLTGDNPLDMVKREKVQDYAHAEALDADTVQKALATMNQRTPRGARDYALLCVLLQTARRAQEVATLTWRNVKLREGKALLTFEHAKGNEVMQDELPVNVTNALLRWLHIYYGEALDHLHPDTPLWVSLAHDSSYGLPLGYQSINALCKKHLGVSKVHATRHTAAHLMEQVGLSVSEIQARLGHKSLATTGRYLASLRKAENPKADEMAARYGIE